MEQLLEVPEYEQLVALLSGDKNSTSGITPIEIQHLCWLGSQVPAGGAIVEIGSHRGKSICAMGCGVRMVGRRVSLFAVDLWTKGQGRTFSHYSSAETWRIFQEQVRVMNLQGMVKPRMMSSAEAARRRAKPIDLLFIDAGHKYPDVHGDYELWKGFVRSGGRIAFHDYGTRFNGVDQTIAEALEEGIWEEPNVYGRIWSARRK